MVPDSCSLSCLFAYRNDISNVYKYINTIYAVKKLNKLVRLMTVLLIKIFQIFEFKNKIYLEI